MEEQAEDHDSTKSDVKLGRLQFRIDYDFNQNNVSEASLSLFLFLPLSVHPFALRQLGWYLKHLLPI